MAIALIALSVIIILLLIYIIFLLDRYYDDGKELIKSSRDDIFDSISTETTVVKDTINKLDLESKFENKFKEFEQKEGIISDGKIINLYKVILKGTRTIKTFIPSPYVSIPYIDNCYEDRAIPVTLERYFSDKVEANEFIKKTLNDNQYTITDNNTVLVNAIVKEQS